MKIQTINSIYTTSKTTLHNQQITHNEAPQMDTLSIGSMNNEVTYSMDTMKSKSYFERVYNYLEGIGYFEGMNEEDKTSFKQELSSNVYTFEEGDISQAVISLSDSLGYLRNIAASISNSSDRQDFLNFIKNYCRDEFAKIDAYRSEIKQQELDKKAQAAWSQLQGLENEIMMLKEMAENSKEQCEAMEEGFDVLAKCFAIAMKIQKGDNVPQSDHEFLLENNPDLYEMAMAMREFKEDPEDCESVLEDDDTSHSEELSTGFPTLETIVSEMPTETE